MQENGKAASLPARGSESDRPQRGPASHLQGFRQDDEGHWVAELSCGHTQHLRHLPPWQNRSWVQDEEQRKARLGTAFSCGWCARRQQEEDKE